MLLARSTFLGAKTLARSLGVWPFLLLAVWVLVTKLQEPAFFVRQGVPFFWTSVQAMLMLVVGLLPLAWRLSQGWEAAAWTLHTSRSTSVQVAATFLAHLLYGTVLILVGLGLSLTLQRILATPISWSAAGTTLFSSFGFACVTASLAPALALIPWTTPGTVSCWLILQALCLGFFGPADSEISFASGAPPASCGILSTLLATLGGVATSLAHANHRLRN